MKGDISQLRNNQDESKAVPLDFTQDRQSIARRIKEQVPATYEPSFPSPAYGGRVSNSRLSDITMMSNRSYNFNSFIDEMEIEEEEER